MLAQILNKINFALRNSILKNRTIPTCIFFFTILAIFPLVTVQGQYITKFSDWSTIVAVEYNDCDGKLTLKFPLAEKESGPSGNSTNRLRRVDIYAKASNNATEELLTSVYRTYSNTSNPPLVPSGHTTSPTKIIFPESLNQQEYGYSTKVNSTNLSSVSSFTKEKLGDIHMVKIVFDDLPDDFFGGTTHIVFRNGYWTEGVDGGIDDEDTFAIDNLTKAADNPQPENGGLMGLNFVRECDQIKLTWDGLASSAFTCTATIRAIIQRKNSNGTYDSVLPFAGATSSIINVSQDSFVDVGLTQGAPSITLSPGVKYDYKVIVVEEKGERRSVAESFISNTETLQPIPPPTIVKASSNGCKVNGDDISLSWMNNIILPDSLVIERSTSSSMDENIFRDTILGNRTSYDDVNAGADTTYYYQLRSMNKCGVLGAPSIVDEDVEGYIEDVPAEPDSVFVNAMGVDLMVTWRDNSESETEFQLIRTIPGETGETIIKGIAPNTKFYLDTDVNICVEYNYKVQVVTFCSSDGIGTENNVGVAPPDLSSTFDVSGDNIFRASKGAHTDKIELTWKNNNVSQTERIRIGRRALESGLPFSIIATEPNDTENYTDFSNEAGVLYEYQIHAEANCANSGTIKSPPVQSIGFRRKTGIVTGKVTYSGGINVANVKITAEDPSNNTFPSVSMSRAQTATIADDPTLDLEDEFIVETWFKPESNIRSFDLIKKSGSYQLRYDKGSEMYKFIVETTAGGTKEVQAPASLFPIDSWTHISGMLYQDSLSLFVNGALKSRMDVTPGTKIKDSSTGVVIGFDFTGKWKELRLWNKGKTDLRLSQDYSRFLAGNEAGLKVYLNAGERKGRYAYDFSKISTDFNNNHALLSATGMWHDTDSPDPARLSIAAFTNTDGDYNMIVPFSGTGQNFVLKPVFGQHMFAPSSRPVTIGETSTVQNNIDFVDISTFRMTGDVTFFGTNCPSSNVLIKIDGEALVKDGNAVFTRELDGGFDIQVPIGRHVITFEKNGHVFSAGRYPGDGREDHNFQDDVLEERFIDSTFRKVIGRVVGGDREGDKPPGMGRSINNIGRANIKFEPKKTCGWINPTQDDLTVTTIDSSGEYEVLLPPLEYVVSRPEIIDTDSGIDVIADANVVVDLRNIPFAMSVVDTMTLQDSTIRIDSARFHKQLDFIYKAPMTIDVTNPDGSPITGDEEYIFSHSKLGNDTIDLTLLGLPFPVFTQNRAYTTLVSTFEEYINYDGAVDLVDRVPITTGNVTLTNELAANSPVYFDLSKFEDYDGDTLYTFLAGQPNLAEDSNPDYHYTKTFEASIRAGTRSDSWTPGDALFRGYVLGVEDVEESDFVTLGPELVDYILRDPPGSQSFAERIKGTTTTTENSWEWNLGGNVDIDATIFGGTAFNLGIGYSTSTEIEATVNIGLNIETSGGEGQTIIETVTNENTWTTSADPLLAGANSDLFIGTSRNFLFGVAVYLAVVPEAACGNSKIECLGDVVNGYSVATQKNLALAGDAFETEFIYTAAHIETYEIPQLEELRNQYLEDDPRYTMLADSLSPCYGANNDDPRWGTEECPTMIASSPDPLISTIEDYVGPSYTFVEVRDSLDSVRIWNQQIRLWKEALAFNEEQKALAVDNPVNYSFGAANTSFKSSQTNTSAFTQSKTFEFFFKETLSFKVGGKIAGAGFDDTYSASLTQKRTEVENNTTENTQTVSFTISDDSEWDDFTFDVYEGSDSGGPIFKTLGGRSSCPHDARVFSKYYKPGTVLSPGTIQLEKPEILITPAEITNVPQGETAVFQMTLKNNNLVGEGWEFATLMRPETNLNSLAVNVGSSDDLTRDWIIPAKSSITRDVFVDIGSVYEYKEILVVMHSTCQYQGGLSVEPDIVDSAYINVSFIPGCTDIEIEDPTDQWVVNNSFKDTLDVKLSGYDYNYLNLEKIQFEYKPSSESAESWVTQKVFYVDKPGLDPTFTLIPDIAPSSLYRWDLSSLPEGEYDFRAKSVCGPDVTNESEIHRGYIDVTNPHAFGTPSPADGILDPEDDIIIRFNEDIDPAYIKNNFNIDVRGRVNGTELRQQESLQFDGNSQYGEIPEYQLQKRSFTIEFWAQRNGTGQEVVFSQGVSTQDQLLVGFDGSNQLYLQLEDQTTSSDFPIPATDTDWHFYAVVYDRATQDVRFYVDNTQRGENINFFADYNSTGPISIGKNSSTDDQYFTGNLQELRIWSIVRDDGSIGETSGITLSGRESGLIGNWPLDDSWGDIAKEKVRGRDLNIKGASWNVDPPSHSYQFKRGDYLIAENAEKLATTPAEDLTIEGWFKTGGGSKQTIMSNGISSALQPALWSISVTASGYLQIENNGNQMITDVKVDDNTWHHFSLVVERGFATSLYLEGDLVETANSSLFRDFGGVELVLGAQVDGAGVNAVFSQHLLGYLDDIRIWNVARKPEQVGRDFINQLIGDEPGLLAYYPFDDYVIPSTPTPTLTDNVIDTSSTATRFDLTAVGGGDFSTTRPTIKLPRVIKSIPKTFSVNGDEMFISLDIDPAVIENVILDITVLGIRDFAGNIMEPAETWVAYIDKNQVFWDTEYFQFEKDIVGNLSFSATIKNSGGSQERYDISNVPSWLRASSVSGLIEPNSTVQIDFTILSLLNIGEYEQDIYVTTGFGFNERLLLDLKVTAEAPVWEIDANAFDYSMNMIGELKINDVISTDDEDMVSVWINDELRGVTHIEKDPESGKHLVFLTISSDATTQDDLEFRAWDASLGRLLVGLTPSDLKFEDNTVVGSPGSPLEIKATVLTQLTYYLKTGWNWISYPLGDDILADVNGTLKDLSPTVDDEIGTWNRFNRFKDSGSWEGSLDAEGFNTNEGYKIFVAEPDTFSYEGLFYSPSEDPIIIEPKWNWIGMKGEIILDIKTALNSLEPSQGDVIKGQQKFAIYDTTFNRWSGNLNFLSPQVGYMYNSATLQSLKYPGSGLPLPPSTARSSAMLKSKVKHPFLKNVEQELRTFSSNMSLTAAISECLLSELSGKEIDLSDWMLSAHVGDEKRGIVQGVWEDQLKQHLFYLTIAGEEASDLKFRLVKNDGSDEILLHQGFTFSTNEVKGAPSAPYLFSCGNRIDCIDDRIFNTADINLAETMNRHKARFGISSDANIPPGIILQFRAGNNVELFKGFQAITGSGLEVFIDDCEEVKQ